MDTLNNKKYKIQDAIQRGLVVAEEVSLQKDEGVSNEIITNQESTFTVIGVLHPTTGEKLTVSKVSLLLAPESRSPCLNDLQRCHNCVL